MRHRVHSYDISKCRQLFIRRLGERARRIEPLLTIGSIANLTFTRALTILFRSLYRPLTPLTLTLICIYHKQKTNSCHTENKICVLYKTGRLMLFADITSVEFYI